MNFAIPFHLQDLVGHSSNQYMVDEVYSSRLIPIKLQNAKIAFAKDGGVAVLEHFDIIYSIISRFADLDPVVKQQAWDILLGGCRSYCNNLANMLSGTTESPVSPQLEPAKRLSHKNSLKMNVYLLTQFADLYQSSYNQAVTESMPVGPGGKGRKVTKVRSVSLQEAKWPLECEKVTRLLMNFIDLDIHRLWNPDLVEDDFLNLFSNLCYKILECPSLVRINDIKESVFHLLGCMVKKFGQSMGTSLKIVQLLQHFSHLSTPLSEAVSLWHNSYKCKSVVSEVLREISHVPEKEFQRDNEGAKNIGNFLVDLSRQCPSTVLANFSLMLSRMNEESYNMRSTLLNMMGEIIIHCLSGEGLDTKAKLARDQFLDYLHDHANLDPNAFTRCRALQVWISLVKEQALPLTRYPDLVELCSSLLLDRSNLVRRFTVQLLEGILRFNPFASKLPIDVLQAGCDEAKEKLNQMIEEHEANKKEENEEEKTQEPGSDQEAEPDLDESVFVEEEEGSQPEEKNKDETPEISKQKDIVSYLENSVRFVQQFHACVPVLCELLRSHVHSDIIEAISFFTAAWEFKLSFALVGVTAMLQQMWHEEQKIRDAVVAAYKQLYFTPEGASSRAKASVIADNLMSLASVSGSGKLKSLEALIEHLGKTGDIPSGVTLILWDRFTKPELNNTASTIGLSTYEQQVLSVQMIGFLAGMNTSIIRHKVDVLVTHGLRSVLQKEIENVTDHGRKPDFSLALQTCITLGKLGAKKHAAGEYEKSMRLPEGHDMFDCLQELVVKGYDHLSDNWEHFASEAISLIYALAESPDRLCEQIVHSLMCVVSQNADCVDRFKKQMFLTRFYLVCGQVAIKQLVYMEVAVQSELKRRRKLKDEKNEAEEKKDQEKHKKGRKSKGDRSESNLEEDMGVGGATADDMEQEFIRNITENELLSKDNLLGMLAPILVRACVAPIHAERAGEVAVQASASLALAKYMQISSSFCENHLQLLFTLLEKSPHETVRANLVIPIGDLCVRFPNLLEPWTSHLYARLKDQSSLVRIYAVKVLSNLILNDMVKVKGHVSEMARCTVDDNEQIASLAKKFFQELSRKGNSIYNVMPDIISRLSDPEVGMSDTEQFRIIMRFLFSFIHKDKQSESLVEKLCHRFSATRVKRQWQDLAFCLSLLSYSEKSIRRLQENFTCFADKLSDEQVYQSFMAIIAKVRKFCKPEVKAQVDELEALINECHQKGVSDDQTAAKAAAVVKKSRRISSVRSPRSFIAWPSRAPDGAETSTAIRPEARSKKRRARANDDDTSSEDSSTEDEPSAPVETSTMRTRAAPVRRLRSTQRRVMDFSSDEDEDSKENVASPSQPDGGIQNDGEDTPIRRKEKPRMSRSTLRA